MGAGHKDEWRAREEFCDFDSEQTKMTFGDQESRASQVDRGCAYRQSR